MTTVKKRNFGHSVFERLLKLAREKHEDFNFLLLRFGTERLLYRLSVSPYADKFILKGASLFLVWQGHSWRVTKDTDLLGIGMNDERRLEKIFREICLTAAGKEDGVTFLPDTVKAEQIREDKPYDGIRVTLIARLHNAKIPLQVDVGFGDSVTPSPEEVVYPAILSLPAPRLRAYTPYTVVAEKFNAMVDLGMANSRMKDFFDIWLMTDLFDFEGRILMDAVRDTFVRRKTPLPDSLPLAFTDAFSNDAAKRTQWAAFLTKSKPLRAEQRLTVVVNRISDFLMPVVTGMQKGATVPRKWPKGGPWLE